MRSLIKILILVYIILALYYATEPPRDSFTEPKLLKSPSPEEGREVYTFDWKSFRYIYRDEIPKKKPIKLGPVKAYPDLFVGTINGKPTYMDDVIIEGRYYEVNVLPTGDVELIPTR